MAIAEKRVFAGWMCGRLFVCVFPVGREAATIQRVRRSSGAGIAEAYGSGRFPGARHQTNIRKAFLTQEPTREKRDSVLMER